jgi:hypothetical protein
MTRIEFLTRWRARREELRILDALVDGAALIDQLLIDVEDLLADEAEVELTLTAAAARSGYSRGHLARLVRQHRIPNSGKRGAPRVRLGDLPIRPGATIASQTRANDDDDPPSACYDPRTDARSLASRRLGAANGRPDSTR